MNAMTKAPNAWQIGKVLELVREMRQRRTDGDGEIETDEAELWEPSGRPIDPHDVMRRLVRAALEAEAMEVACDRRIDDIEARKVRYRARKTEYRRSLSLVMQALDIDKFVDADATVSLRPNKGGAVVIVDEDKLADEYMRVTRTPDRVKIGADLKAGVVVDGAILSQGGEPVLTFRSK